MADYKKFMRTLRSSKRYEMDCEGHITVTDYYTGESFTLDLSLMDEETFNELVVEDEEEYEDE